jgi:methyl-accepting chemotaxis protein
METLTQSTAASTEQLVASSDELAALAKDVTRMIFALSAIVGRRGEQSPAASLD